MKRVYMVLLALCLLLAGCGGQKTDEVDLKPVCIDGKWGYTNAKGELVIEPRYGFARAFAENGLAPVKVDQLWGYIDREGNMVIQPQFFDAEPFDSTGTAMVVTSDAKRATLQEDGTYTVLSDSEIVLVD